ncbi:MAG: DinB family protein [Vicinamibacterales bacterium]
MPANPALPHLSTASMSHTQRTDDLLARLDEATRRFVSRLERAGPLAEAATTGWTAAQVGAHVALVNDNFTTVFDGSNPALRPPLEEFVERPWSAVAAAIPERLEAPARFIPPAGISGAEAAERVRQSAARLATAIAAVPPERGRYCFTNRIVGTISVYQAGDWAIAHIIRHNQQAKRILGQ